MLTPLWDEEFETRHYQDWLNENCKPELPHTLTLDKPELTFDPACPCY